MAREITEQDLANKGVAGLPDVPGLTTEAMQKKFDEISRELLVPRFNEMAKEVNEVNENLEKKYSSLIASNVNNTDDPNTTTLPIIRTKHANCPDTETEWIILTMFTDSDNETSEKTQIGIKTSGHARMAFRVKSYGGAWTEWIGNATLAHLSPSNGAYASSITWNQYKSRAEVYIELSNYILNNYDISVNAINIAGVINITSDYATSIYKNALCITLPESIPIERIGYVIFVDLSFTKK